ncbi:hypothetical protein P7K49_015529 [Saguinus oedipus]|uniref:Uncharacterized protein n=1 Tax=Saguinus oedipus TaxID=9490 RepID=A0ABQ9VA31_SAGOE|nr:hypothetical protein P7K49_015529 [Saguinus oedipus]
MESVTSRPRSGGEEFGGVPPSPFLGEQSRVTPRPSRAERAWEPQRFTEELSLRAPPQVEGRGGVRPGRSHPRAVILTLTPGPANPYSEGWAEPGRRLRLIHPRPQKVPSRSQDSCRCDLRSSEPDRFLGSDSCDCYFSNTWRHRVVRWLLGASPAGTLSGQK